MWWKWRGLPPGVTARTPSRFLLVLVFFSLFFIIFVGDPPVSDDLRTAHLRSAEGTGCYDFHLYALL
jgi:hypothetical protein